MPESLRILLIGASGIAGSYSEIIRGLPGAHVCGIVSRDRGYAEQFASRHGIEHSGTSIEVMAQKTRSDAALICSRPSDHISDATSALDAGCNILVEKPLCLNIRTGEELMNMASSSMQIAMVISQLRYDLDIIELGTWVRNRTVDSATLVSNWSRDEDYFKKNDGWRLREGDLLFNQLIHWLDILLLQFGTCQNVKVSECTWPRDHSGPDSLKAKLSFQSGTVQVDATTNALSQGERFLITSGNSSWEYSSVIRRGILERLLGRRPVPRLHHKAQIEAFIDSCKTGTPRGCTLEQGLAAVRLATEIRAACKGVSS